MKQAARVDANQVAIVKGLRNFGYRVQVLSALGKGVPDLLVGTPRGDLVLLELKDGAKPPSERKLTDDQEKWHADWRRFRVYVVTNLEGAMAACNGQVARPRETG